MRPRSAVMSMPAPRNAIRRRCRRSPASPGHTRGAQRKSSPSPGTGRPCHHETGTPQDFPAASGAHRPPCRKRCCRAASGVSARSPPAACNAHCRTVGTRQARLQVDPAGSGFVRREAPAGAARSVAVRKLRLVQTDLEFAVAARPAPPAWSFSKFSRGSAKIPGDRCWPRCW